MFAMFLGGMDGETQNNFEHLKGKVENILCIEFVLWPSLCTSVSSKSLDVGLYMLILKNCGQVVSFCSLVLLCVKFLVLRGLFYRSSRQIGY